MNQRRARGMHRSYSASNESPLIAPAADFVMDDDANYLPETPTKRKPTTSSCGEHSGRICGHCKTSKSAGKWRRDREFPDRYLCNKCGMNQRRAQSRCLN